MNDQEYIKEILKQSKQVMELTNQLLDTDFCLSVASTKKRMLEAYLKLGFTREEAMQLLVNDNISLSNK